MRKRVKNQQAPNIHVKVTKQHIKDGLRNNSYRCMGVLAVHDSFKNARYVTVRDGQIRLTDKRTNLRHYYPLEYKALLQVAHYDNGEKIRPFSFKLDGSMTKTFQAGSAYRTLDPDRHKKPVQRTVKMNRPTAQRIAGAGVFIKK